MATQSEYLALIEKLKAATEGSRELDAAVARAYGIDFGVRYARFTRSIDAALSLKPDETNRHGYELGPSFAEAWFSHNYCAEGTWLFTGTHPMSIPLAFCIAALKYRVEQLSTKAPEG